MSKRRLQKLILLILLTSSFNCLTSCAVSPPQVNLCIEINPFRGYCANTITSKSFYVDDLNKYKGKSWFEIRPTMIQMPSDSWAEIKSFIIKVCKKYNCANFEISNWERTVQGIDEVIEAN